MENLSLASLFEEDREMVLANLARDRALPAAQQTLEKAVDRVMYRYVEACGDDLQRRNAQIILQAIKNALPLMDTVGEARSWKKQAESSRGGIRGMAPSTLAMALAGAVLVLGSVLGVMIGGRLLGILAFVKALLPAGLGGCALFLAGARSSRPGKEKRKDAIEDVRTEYLVDCEKAWHCLHGALLQADGQLRRIREDAAVAAQISAEAIPAGALDSRALELFAGLLESAYASGDENARDSISAMRFYLHNAAVDVADYEPGRESWFEFLPSGRPGTMRPALTSNGRLLKKGLASK